MEINQFKNMLY